MKRIFLIGTALFALVSLSQATTLVVGTPNDADNGTVLAPRFGVLINFDDLTPFTSVASNAYASSGVQSITSTQATNPLLVYPFSSQSAPNYVSTTNQFGGLTVTLYSPTNIMGIGVLESDGSPLSIAALGATGNTLGIFSVTVPTTGNTPYNAYYILEDPTNDIKSLQLISGGQFGVDDLQFAPEPISFALAGAGLVVLGLARARRKKQ
ncbi:MAG: hypothetical protein JO051_04295 [Acidobacteriaceae bacterium]|nr:hypothetical protein [Acidobacteriaceae bacterium]